MLTGAPVRLSPFASLQPVALLLGLSLPLASFAADTTLSTIEVKATLDEDSQGLVTGYVAERSASGTKTSSKLRETPQSISVVTADRLESQKPRSINEALMYTPGLGTYGADTRSDFYMTLRGLEANFYMDGLPLPVGKNYAGWRVDPFLVERLEVVRGPSSVLYGQANPGGSLNLITKKPTTEQIRKVELQYGSHDRKQIGVDLGGSLSEDNDWSYRLVGVGRHTDIEANPHDESYATLAPTLQWQPSEVTRLTLRSSYLKQNADTSANFLPASGTVQDNPNGKIAADLYTGDQHFAGYHKTQKSLGYSFEHLLNDQWRFRQNLNYAELKLDNQTVFGIGYYPSVDPSLNYMFRRAAYATPQYNRLGIDNQLEGLIRSCQVEHRWLFGLDYQNQLRRDPLAYGVAVTDQGMPSAIQLYSGEVMELDSALSLQSPYGWGAEHTEGRIKQFGIYVQDQVKVDHWLGLASLRLDKADTETRSTKQGTYVAGIEKSSQQQNDHKATGRLGLLYAADNGLSPYLSYSTSFVPTTGVDADNKAFKPTTGQQYETGIKYQPNPKTSVNLALFDIRQQNVLTSNGVLEQQTGEVRSKGVELEASAELVDSLRLIANYTHLNTKTSQSDNPDEIGKRPVTVPKNSASVWLDYQLPQGIGLGYGLRYVGKMAGDALNSFDVPSYQVSDAMLSYQLNDVRLSLNATNLFDKEYIAACGDASACFYAPGRQLLGTVAYLW